jgi:Holliday junction resolvase RusA-like endonuclease
MDDSATGNVRTVNGLIVLTVSGVPPGPNGPRGMLRSHWTRRRKIQNDWICLIGVTLRDQGIWSVPPVDHFVQVRIWQTRKRQMDPDNLTASCKVILDALKHHGLIKDDSPKWISLVVNQGTGKIVRTQIVLECS